MSILAQLAATMVDFDPLFEVLPGTKREASAIATHNPYEAVTGKSIPE